MKRSFIVGAVICLLALTNVWSAQAEPSVARARLANVSGVDADQNGYFETVRFEVEMIGVCELGSDFDVKARLVSTGTEQNWQSEWWTLRGEAPETVYIVFNEEDFELEGQHELEFVVELWCADLQNNYDSVAVEGGPIRIESISTPEVAAPGMPILENETHNSIDITVIGNEGPAETLYAVRCKASSPFDPQWDGSYVKIVDGAGVPSAEPHWALLAEWEGVTISMLAPSTMYSFAARAQLGEGISVKGPAAWAATLDAPANPLALDLTTPTATTLKVGVSSNLPAGSFAVECIASNPYDSEWTHRFVGTFGSMGVPVPFHVWNTTADQFPMRLTGLKPDTTYTFVLHLNDNGGAASIGPAQTIRTLAAGELPAPPAPEVKNVTANAAELTVKAAAYADATTLYAVSCVASSPIDSGWHKRNVWPLEGRGLSYIYPAWRPINTWSGLQLLSLRPSTRYEFKVRALHDNRESEPTTVVIETPAQ